MARSIGRSPFLRLLFQHLKYPGRMELPSVCGRRHDRGLNDMHLARSWFGAVIVVLIEIVKVSTAGEAYRSRQDNWLHGRTAITHQDELSVIDWNKQFALVVECYVDLVRSFSSLEIVCN